eukprot:CAMPEP_0171154374 /NCGR_PEP_ID=MMETSP0790-20130122/282_1 /TAXON_ID=2925 /ORGANISM="Alexandrium catenella, Strain OF101" /LENGTH=46 /DNA_ID= /DNA_START= /DNA_END= /DNA_ORIENTATION=
MIMNWSVSLKCAIGVTVASSSIAKPCRLAHLTGRAGGTLGCKCRPG